MIGSRLTVHACLITKLFPTLATRWTALQVPLSLGFPRQEYCNELPFPPGDLLNPGIKPMSPALAGGFFTTEPPR